MISIEGNIVNIDNTHRGRVEIGSDGLILSVTKETGHADLVLKDELIFPGFIDLHVHARECADHSWDYKEDFISASEAAINGGVVCFCDMPNNPVAPVTDLSYNEKSKLVHKAKVEVVLYAGIGPKTKPLSKNVPYKVFMGPSVGDLFFSQLKPSTNSRRASDEALLARRSFSEGGAKSDKNISLEEVIKNYHGQNISFHCEDPAILEANKNQPTHEQKRPQSAENSAVDFALSIIEKYNITAKICHCSTVEGMQKIIAAKKRGVKVTCEVTPHHLFFDETLLNNANHQVLQVNPPIRQTKDNRLALIEMLKNGDIDYLATDHAPHTWEEKEKGTSGMPHLDTYGSFATWLIKEHNFTASDAMRVCSYNPGMFVNQFTSVKYGKIEVGYVGSLSILDLNQPIKIEKTVLKTKCGWSPFEGIQFPGRVIKTIVKGKVYENNLIPKSLIKSL